MYKAIARRRGPPAWNAVLLDLLQTGKNTTRSGVYGAI